jgi:hypothetical protein
MPRYLPAGVAAALIGGFIATVGAQPAPTDPGAAANVRQSRQYDQAIEKNKSFRAKRLKEECGPITDPQLHASCVSSFGGAAN